MEITVSHLNNRIRSVRKNWGQFLVCFHLILMALTLKGKLSDIFDLFILVSFKKLYNFTQMDKGGRILFFGE